MSRCANDTLIVDVNTVGSGILEKKAENVNHVNVINLAS